MSAASDAWEEFRRKTRCLSTVSREYKRIVAEHAWLREIVEANGFSFSYGRNLLDTLFSALGAVRKICSNADSDLYTEDMVSLADAGVETSDLRQILELCGIDAVEWFSAANIADFCCTEDGYFCARDDTHYCERSGEVYSNDDEFVTVHINRHNTEQWHESAADSHAFRCHYSEEWYSRNGYTQGRTDEDETICAEVADTYDFYWSGNRGVYTRDSDDDDEEGQDGIPEYHCSHKPWSFALSNRATIGYFGIEIEVAFDSRGDRSSFYHSCISGSDYVAETDGSLDDERGLEIITRPFTLHELRAEKSPLRKLYADFEHHDADCCDEQDNSYGIHVTTNWGRLGKDHRKRLQSLMYDMRSLTVFVAGRDVSYANLDKAVMHDSGHYRAAHPRDCGQALEFRVFKTTLDYDVLLSYVEFVDAAVEWTRDPHHLTTGPLAQSLFRHWFCLSGAYPHLTARFPTSSAKELHPCVLPSTNRQVLPSTKTRSGGALRPILTEPVSRARWMDEFGSAAGTQLSTTSFGPIAISRSDSASFISVA